jgi:hypothetical protein
MNKFISIITVFIPSFVLAQTVITDVSTLTQKLVDIGNVVIYLLIALAVIFIVWNVVMALIRGDDPTEKKKALGNIGYGVLGLAIIVSIWGLVNILVGTFKTTPNNAPTDRFPSADFINKNSSMQGSNNNTQNYGSIYGPN